MADGNPAEKAASAAKNKMSSLENALGKQASKLPKMSDSNRKMFAGVMPWAAGAFGALALYWSKQLWDVLRDVDAIDESLGEFGSLITSIATPSESSLWVAVALYALIGVFVVWAFVKGLLKQTKAGWTFLFYAMVAAVLAGAWYLLMLSEFSGGRGWLTGLGGLFGLYLLFQTKDSYSA